MKYKLFIFVLSIVLVSMNLVSASYSQLELKWTYGEIPPSNVAYIVPAVENKVPHIKLSESLRFTPTPHIRLGEQLKFNIILLS